MFTPCTHFNACPVHEFSVHECHHCMCNCGSIFTGSFLKKFYHEIKTDMDARDIALELYHDEAIPEGVKTNIQNARDAKSANLLLYDHLLNQASLSTLTNVCGVMSEVEGMDRMKSLGRRMKEELQQYNSSRDSS